MLVIDALMQKFLLVWLLSQFKKNYGYGSKFGLSLQITSMNA